MSEILPSLIVPRDPAAAEGAVSPGAKEGIDQAWLRELERAQLQRQRGASRAPVPAREAKSAGAPEAREAPRALPRPQTTEPQVSSHAVRKPSAAAFAGPARGAAPERGLLETGGPMQAPPAVGVQGARVEDLAPALEAEIARRLLGERRRWEPRRVHARTREGKVQLWIRDAELEPPHAAELIAWLSQLVREQGLELEGITVNGHVVYP
jgi:hypothetical protein